MTNTRTVYFLVNGIANWPGCPKNWNKRAAAWLTLNTPHAALLDEYFTTALTVWIHERDRARSFAALLKEFAGWRIVIVAHSNGTRIVLQALERLSWPMISALHLVAGACDADFARNGLNRALLRQRIGVVHVYWGGKDRAMRIEDTLAGKALFGLYGELPMGLRGAQSVPLELTESGRVVETYRMNYGHSTWWAPEHFDTTMKFFL